MGRGGVGLIYNEFWREKKGSNCFDLIPSLKLNMVNLSSDSPGLPPGNGDYNSDSLCYTVYSGYSGQVYSGHSDIVATFPGTNYIYSSILMSDIVANRI